MAAERVGVGNFTFDVQRLGGASCETLPQRLLRAIGSERDDHDIAALRFLDSDCLLERELVVWRDDELQSGLVDAAISSSDLDARFGVRDLRDANDTIQMKTSDAVAGRAF
jgi:hypothetical protein